MRNRVYRLDLRGLSLRNVLRILEKYPDATFRDASVTIDLGMKERTAIAEPVSDAENAVHWDLDARAEALRGISPEVSALVDALTTHPAVTAARKEHARKLALNNEAALAAAHAEDEERDALQKLVQVHYDRR